MAMEYYSFENVLNELQMDEEELKRLVSEGQIRAFRDENRMKFRKDDIDSLRRGKQDEPTFILPDEPEMEQDFEEDLVVIDPTNDETMLDLESEGIEIEEDDSSVPAIELDDVGTQDIMTEELVFDESDEFGELEATQKIDEDFLEDEDDIGMSTEPLGMDDEDDADATMVDESPIDDEFDDEPTIVERAPRQRMGRAAKRAAAAKPAPKPAASAAPAQTIQVSAPAKVSFLWVLILGVSVLIFIYAMLVIFDASKSTVTGATEPFAKMMSEKDRQGNSLWRFYQPKIEVSQKPRWIDVDNPLNMPSDASSWDDDDDFGID